MRYRAKGVEIRSENAAKPRAQRSRYLESQLRSVGPYASALDYGCGKLRYFPTLRAICRNLTIVDSSVQLNRIQTIGGRLTTIREYVTRWPSVTALDVDEFARDTSMFDFALCSNVLSAIPSYKTRLLVVAKLAKRLHPGGHALFVVQYTNSHFTALRSNPQACKYLDGYLVSSRRGNSFYGIITPAKLSRLLVKGGFQVQHLWRAGQSAYAWTKCAIS
jgi:2-polyprenyl-3-methyl-5-hydroxy-6-metoxy-1,4-benzoquinol methylase